MCAPRASAGASFSFEADCATVVQSVLNEVEPLESVEAFHLAMVEALERLVAAQSHNGFAHLALAHALLGVGTAAALERASAVHAEIQARLPSTVGAEVVRLIQHHQQRLAERSSP